MGREHIHGLSVPLYSRHAYTFPHEDLAIEPPEAATVCEGDEADLGDGVLGEDGQPGAAEGHQERGAAQVDALVVGDVGHAGGDDVVVLSVPDFLEVTNISVPHLANCVPSVWPWPGRRPP